MKIVFATHNKDKLREIKEILEGLEITVLCADDFPGFPETIEDGRTFAENALKKAREFSKNTNYPALADDSGICVDALDGAPGIFSARFAGEDCTYDDNNRKLLALLDGVPKENRKAHFICTSALVFPNEKEFLTVGRLDGTIAFSPRGSNGFGYDPVFELPNGKTLAELSPKEKNSISHRGIAFRKLAKIIEKIIDRDR